ncbi:MAG: hypothetical protein HZA90_24530 [Verrucomicrobia bacterium]|nr:hypothetical protein [Verrucomicrobiota bacterium]
MKASSFLALALPAVLAVSSHAADSTTTEVKNASINGGLQDGKARLVIEADLTGVKTDKEKLLFAAALEHVVQVSREKVAHSFAVKIDILQGEAKEIPLAIAGEGEIKQVTGDGLQDWSLRQDASGTRFLVVRPKKEKATNQLAFTVAAERELKGWRNPMPLLTLTPPQPALFSGYVKIETTPEHGVQATNPSGVVPIEIKFLPESLRAETKPDEAEPLAFRFQGSAYSIPLQISIADPEMWRVVLTDLQLAGQLSDDTAAFTLTTTARVKNPTGQSLMLLFGNVALTELTSSPDWRIKRDQDRFVLVFDKPGEFPIQLKFNAAVKPSNGWSTVDFRIAPAALQPVTFRGLAADTQFQFAGAARPERSGNNFTSFLPADGTVKLAWKETRAEVEGKLFYSAEMLSQVSIRPGVILQVALLDGKVMQGELNRMTLRFRGPGRITALDGVYGTGVLAWNVEPVPNSADTRVTVQFNRPQKDTFALQVSMQAELGAFPQTMEVMRIVPEGATRVTGHVRVVNDGAVRLEVLQATGLSQISPESFPSSDKIGWQPTSGNQRFVYRFASVDFALRVQADNVLPELSVSEVIAYHLGETELAIDAEVELDVREAPVRELTLRVPKGFALARLNAAGLSDYFLREPADQSDAELRLVYGQPVSGRQVIQLRLERNKPLAEAAWVLPKIEVSKAKSTRGHVGVSADAGFRLTPETTQALTDIATAFFPKKLANIQAAFRLTEPTWAATMRVERLPQTVQADAFHLFSIGEGIAYGSSVLNYLISGAPVSAFRIELSNEYFNVEFTGKDVRNWTKTTNGYVVQLHTPVSGAFTLLTTYERPFRAQGDTLTFTGARPLDAQTEQGHTIVVSAYQFQVQPAQVSAGLLALETGEVPPEYRLFFDAPILAAYRYTSRPFSLRLALSPLAQGETLGQVVDRASLTTRISKEGQVITDARYFVKNRGVPHLRLTLPEGTELWSVTVNGVAAVPVKDAKSNLIPLPQRADPNAVLTVDLKLASRSKNPKRVSVSAPIVAAPVMLGEWKVEPDTKQRLVYRAGSLTPAGGVADVSGFAGLTRMLTGREGGWAFTCLVAALVLTLITMLLFRWASAEGVYRFSGRHVGCGLLGLSALVIATVAFVILSRVAERNEGFMPRNLSFLAPVQQAGSALSLEVDNLKDELSVGVVAGRLWPVLLALAIWVYAWATSRTWFRPVGWILGWTLLAWVALRWPNGAAGFLWLLCVFVVVQVVVPALRRLWRMPSRPAPTPPGENGVATAAAAVMFMATLLASGTASAASTSTLSKEPPIAESVTQQIRVEDKFAFATAKVRWPAWKGQSLPLLFEPAVVTQIKFPTNALKLVQFYTGSRRGYQLLAQADGTFDVEVQYQLQVAKKDAGESGFALPTQFGLVNRLALDVDLDVDVASPQAVSVQRDAAVTNRTVASLVLLPLNEPWIAWKPRSRDVKREKAVFYAEVFQLYVPSAGVIEGLHQVQVRPAQGELSELIFDVPGGATISDASSSRREEAPSSGPTTKTRNPNSEQSLVTSAATSSLISLWRFDPDTRKLRVTLNPPQSKPFTLTIRSQVATGPLPFEQSVGLISVNNAASQLGLLGIATGSEVQLDSVIAEPFSSINLEDFPGSVLGPLQAQFAGLTVRRAFRYSEARGTASLKASPVEPDVRVEAQQTLSLSEDRTVLAANLSAEITRAGIFRLSFILPTSLEVETISGQALSHWTELKTTTNRTITLHLKGKTVGQQQFAISLVGSGVRAATNWAVPRLILREASKQQGQLVIVPEQGMRLQPTTRDGVTLLDPQRAGIRQKGVLAFRLLHGQWALALDLEQVDPWIQVTSFQHVTVAEAQVKVAANLQYQIENTGLKAFRISLPTNAESVRFVGEQVADFLPVAGRVSDGMQEWEVKLHRRIIGRSLLQVTYQWRVAENAAETTLRGVQAGGVNLQRGFVTVQSGGRLQVRTASVPAALQPSDWQTVPRVLRQDIEAASANFTFRLVEAAYALPIQLERHEAAKLLPARVNSIVLTSVISDEGVMLTQVRLNLIPGDKRLLHLTLPTNANFWFAFVNQNGVSPWRANDQVLIPLEQQTRGGQAVAVELFYSSTIGKPGTRALDLSLLGPRFDLPLENIQWQVYLSEKWQLQDWSGTLQLQDQKTVAAPVAIDVQTYLQNEATLQRQKTQQAEQMLALGNTALEQGDPQQARQAFRAAFGLSTHDDAFNEDARVQLHNLKLQQALVGLNVKQAATAGETGAVAGKLRDLRARKALNYTQQEAKQIIDANTAEDNTALMRLAERMIQQQDAAVSAPAAIRASIPQQGRLLTFVRAVQVDTWADLRIGIEARAAKTASFGVKLGILAGVFAALALLAWPAKSWFGKKASEG